MIEENDEQPIGAVLAPLRARYAHWLSLDDAGVQADRDEAGADVRALQLILRMERGAEISWHGAVSAAATGALAVCLDPEAEPGGQWHEAVAAYCAGHIRKVTRRARGAHWRAAGELDGIDVTVAGAEVRALVPGLVAELDARIARLQVGGTDTAVDDPPSDDALPDPSNPHLELYVAAEPVMTVGKTMAQAGHASMIAAALLAGDDQPGLRRWLAAGLPVDVHRPDAKQWNELLTAMGDPAHAWREDRLVAVRDAGFTEIAPGTITVVARVSG